MSTSVLSADPFLRYAEIVQRAAEGRPWYESVDVLRCAAAAVDHCTG